ncbi:putative protein N(5)-glutamine methyltransferase [Streptomyces griseoaurantiacus]|uniref:putative protein N(5)-glutamine methyltransferase n=1 Tax=Streptomyces griseoaurantiacus TaxID=68213 RepID=UPI0037B28508
MPSPVPSVPPQPPVPSVPPVRSSVVAALRAAGCVFAEDEAELIFTAARTASEITAMVDRRVAGEPLEIVVGRAEFHGLLITVEPGVFVPRRRTEFLVDQALALTPDAGLVVDLCCGSGAVGVALAASPAAPRLHAADIDPVAARCARRNLAPYEGHVHEGDLYAALPDALRGRIDVLTANVPYVPSDEVRLLPAEAREHEPPAALDGGTDGLDLLRRVAAGAPRWLAPGGALLVETSERQAPAALAAFTGAGLDARLAHEEEYGTTVVIGLRR